MKKLIFVLAFITFIGAGTAFADYPNGLAIGVQGGYGGLGGGAGVTFVLPGLPVFFVIDALGLGENGFGISGAGDFYIPALNFRLMPSLDAYIRGGVGVSLWGFGGELGMAASARLPIGLSWRPIRLLELYLQIVPQIGLQILPGIDLWGNFWGGNLGLRLWL